MPVEAADGDDDCEGLAAERERTTLCGVISVPFGPTPTRRNRL